MPGSGWPPLSACSCSLIAWPMVRRAAEIASPVAVTAPASIPVTPCRAAKAVIVRASSISADMKSAPIAPCVCRSISPGPT